MVFHLRKIIFNDVTQKVDSTYIRKFARNTNMMLCPLFHTQIR